jgi:Ca-activated chloride channel family protein
VSLLAAAWQFSVLGTPARFALPWVLWGFAGVGLAGLFWTRLLLQRRRALARIAPERLLPTMAPRGGQSRDLAGLISALTGVSLLLVAAAQPECGARTIRAKRYGMDVVIALDASMSMIARDVKPSRIERAKLELTGLIDRLKGDRVGIVVFAGDAFVQCPLTTDYSAAKLFLKAVDPKDLPQQGTALAAALTMANTLFEGADRGAGNASGRSIVLLTDGEDHEGEVDDEAKKLGEEGVKVFTVGIGSKTGEPIPIVNGDGNVTGYKKDRSGQTIMTRLNEEVLESIAQATGGKYVHSASGDLGVGEIVEELDRMDKAEFETRLTVEYDERFEYFAWPGAVLLGLAWALGEGRFRRRREAVA